MTRQPSVRGLVTAALYVAVMALCAGAAFYAGDSSARAEAEEAANKANPELDALRTRFGAATNSRGAEEWIVKDFFNDQRGGVFVDVGANHHQRFSNTFYLETELGWSGVAIEPQIKFADGYRRHRPRTVFVPLFVTDVSNKRATLYVPRNDLIASASQAFAEAWGAGSVATPTTTTTLDDVLVRNGVTRVDFLSMDIELGEPRALAGFSIDRFKPRLACVEAHLAVRQQILDYFTSHGYVIAGKYWRADIDNFWFVPLGDSSALGSPEPMPHAE
jgi:FkbM family methyltransferase